MSPTVSEFKSVMDSCCLSQYIDFPTHLHGHTLDLLMAPSEFSAISDVKGSGFISDHKIISCDHCWRADLIKKPTPPPRLFSLFV